MARPLRIDVEDGWYHVYGRGIDRRNIFNDDRERLHFLELLALLVERYRIVVHAYALMSNHYHLILQTPEANLSAAMQWFATSYSMWFNPRNERVGPLFQGRFGGLLIENSAWAYEASLYVHLNPVMRADFGLDPWRKKAESLGWTEPTAQEVKERLSEIRKYPWSSYRAYAGYAGAPEWLTTKDLLQRAARRKDERVAAYRSAIKLRLTKGVSEPFQERLRDGVALGSADFVKRVKGLLKGGGRDVSGKRALRRRIEFEEVIKAVEKVRGVSFAEFTATRGDWGKPLALWAARQFCGLTLRELGEKLGGKDYAAVGMMIKRFETKASKDRMLRDIMKKVKGLLLQEC